MCRGAPSFVFLLRHARQESFHGWKLQKNIFFSILTYLFVRQGINEYGIIVGIMLLSLFLLLLKVEAGRSPDLCISIQPAQRLRLYFQVAVCISVEALLPCSVALLWGDWRESLLAHGVAVAFTCAQAYYFRACHLDGETARMRVAVLIVFFLLALSVLLSAHYALGAACWVGAIVPVLSLSAVLDVISGSGRNGRDVNSPDVERTRLSSILTYMLALTSMLIIGVVYSPPLGLALLNK